MGHRASYAIRDHGNVSLYASHWGALTVPMDVFWGPEYALAFVRSNEPTDHWFDDVWGEGGIAIDVDEKVVAFFGGELDGEMVRNTFVELMRELWSGWAVRWVEGMPDIAATVGVDPAVVTSPRSSDAPFENVERDEDDDQVTSRPEAIEIIAQALFRADDSKDEVIAFAARVAKDLTAQSATFAPGLLTRTPDVGLDDEGKRELFERALRAAHGAR